MLCLAGASFYSVLGDGWEPTQDQEAPRALLDGHLRGAQTNELPQAPERGTGQEVEGVSCPPLEKAHCLGPWPACSQGHGQGATMAEMSQPDHDPGPAPIPA